MAAADRDTYLAGLTPGAAIDHSGTPFTEDLLQRLLTALHDPVTRHPHLGDARFYGAHFSGHANFGWAQFSGDARFDGAQFSGDARFRGAEFSRHAGFGRVRFSGHAEFRRTQFSGAADFVGAQFAGTAQFDRVRFSWPADFGEAQFAGAARFAGVRFSGSAGFLRAQFSSIAHFFDAKFRGDAVFLKAQFSGDAVFPEARFFSNAAFDGTQFAGATRFGGVRFSGHARFCGTQFLETSWWGPVACAGELELSGAVFGSPVTLEIAAREVRCARTRWESTATVRVRHAAVDLGYAVLAVPVAVTAHPEPFTTAHGGALAEDLLAGPATVRVVSVEGVDAALLVLTDTDLSDCLFSGTFHLDQIRLEGRTLFASPPTGWHRQGLRPVRWTRRRTLAEEHHWRAQTARPPAPPAGRAPSPRRWRTGAHHPDQARTPDPADIAALYRQLRKAFEDGKNEPGAADFYYGECEMRRHDRTGTPTTERLLLWAYWLLSGYGLRATRALGWLLTTMIATIVLLMGFGLPESSPKQEASGTVPSGGGKVTFAIDKQAPKNPARNRFTSVRFEKALNITLNSVVFRSSGQDLTTAGTYIEMGSRLVEPALLALAVLAVRGRIKR